MAQWTQSDVRDLLEEKLAQEVERIKRKGMKPGLLDLADAIAPFVLALMSDCRRRELGRLEKWLEKNSTPKEIQRYVQSRKAEMQLQAKAVWHLAEKLEQEKRKLR